MARAPSLQPVAPPPEPAKPAPYPQTDHDFDGWAKERHLTDQLRTPAAALLPVLPSKLGEKLMAWQGPAGLTLGDLLSESRWRSYGTLYGVFTRAEETLIRVAALRSLEAEAQLVKVGLEEEERRKPCEPEPPVLRALAGKLEALRKQLRRAAWPRARSSWGSMKLALEEDPGELQYWEEGLVLSGRGELIHPRVVISMERWRRQLARPSCSCSPSEPQTGCIHQLSAVDAFLALLVDPARVEEQTRLATELDLPDWERALRAVDIIEAEHARRREGRGEVRFSYRLKQGGTAQVWGIQPVLHKRRKGGDYTSGKAIGSRRELIQLLEVAPDEDLQVLDLLVDRWGMDQDCEDVLQALVGRAEVFLDVQPEVRIEVAERRLELLAAEQKDGGVQLVPALGGRSVEPELFFRRIEAAGPGGVIAWLATEWRECSLVRVTHDAVRLMAALLSRGGRFPKEGLSALVARACAVQQALHVELPAGLKGEQVPPDERLHVELALARAGGLRLAVRVSPLADELRLPPGEGPVELFGSREGRRVFVRRELEQERARASAFLESLPRPGAVEEGPSSLAVPEDEAAIELVAHLQEHPPEGVLLEWREQAPVLTRAAGPADLRVQIQDRRDWFGLSGQVEVDGAQVELARLLDAARRGSRFVRVDERSWVVLTSELQRRLVTLADVTFEGRSGVEISPAAGLALEPLASAGTAVEAPESWVTLAARIRRAATLEPAAPEGLAASLRDYQLEGYRWMARLAAWGTGACLADDMGLGKTLQALALLVSRREAGPALVVAPTSLGPNWMQETRRFAPTLRPILYREANRERILGELAAGDLLIVSYGLLAREVERFQAVRFATLVLDEAQAIKNANTQRARAARDLDAEFRVALSGTPVENHLGELWSLFRIVLPGLLGSWEQFRERFASPIERDKDPRQRAALARVVRPFLLRRTKAEVARELPSRTEIQLSITLSPEERQLYEEARLAAVARLVDPHSEPGEDRRFETLAEITKLRLLACHPRLYEAGSKVGSSKLERLMELVKDLREGAHRALVFSQFTKHLALVREQLDAAGISYLYLDGQTPAAERGRLVERFQAGEGELFLISLKAGGMGLNLTAADYVIHLDPWWNPAVEDQATDRAHRIGQTKPVTVYRLVASGTIEEAILSLHAEKRDLVNGLLEGADVAGKLSTAELVELVKAGAGAAAEEAEDGPPGEGAAQVANGGDVKAERGQPPRPDRGAERPRVDTPPRSARRG